MRQYKSLVPHLVSLFATILTTATACSFTEDLCYEWGKTPVLVQSESSNLVEGVFPPIPLNTSCEYAGLAPGEITQVSQNEEGASWESGARRAWLSQNGRYLTFSSSSIDIEAKDLITEQPVALNGTEQLFVMDLKSRVTYLVSSSVDGELSNAGPPSGKYNQEGSIDAKGTAVVFSSTATNLVPGDTSDNEDVFLRFLVDRSGRKKGDLIRISRKYSRGSLSSPTSGMTSNGNSSVPSISGNGKYVVFSSQSSDLVPNDKNNTRDVFRVSVETNAVKLVSVSSTGNQGDDAVATPSMNYDGRFIAFPSYATNLIDGQVDTNDVADVFLRDMTEATTMLISIGYDGMPSSVPPNSGSKVYIGSFSPTISNDGRFVVFDSLANNLISPTTALDNNGIDDVFLFDAENVSSENNAISLLSESTSGKTTADGRSDSPSISGAGNRITWKSNASDMDGIDASGVFVYDPSSGTLVRGSVDENEMPLVGKPGDDMPGLSADGRLLSFTWCTLNCQVYLRCLDL